jgi:hypothetical protein
MKRTLLTLSIVALLLVSPILAEMPEGDIPWRDDYDAARAEARDAGKLMVVYFWGKRCPECEAMAPVWTDDGVLKAADRVVWVRVDGSKNTPLKKVFWVGHPPSMVLADTFGTKVAYLKGVRPAEQIAGLLDALPVDVSEMYDLTARVESSPEDPEALIRLGEMYRGYGWFEASNTVLRRVPKIKSVSKDSKWADDAVTLVAFNLMNLNRPQEVQTELLRCIQRFPDSEHRPQHLLGLVWAGLQENQRPEIKPYLLELQAKYPDRPETGRAEALVAAFDEG